MAKAKLIALAVKIGVILLLVVIVIATVKNGLTGMKIKMDFAKVTNMMSSDSQFAMSKKTKKAQNTVANTAMMTQTMNTIHNSMPLPLKIFTSPFRKFSMAAQDLATSRYELAKSTDTIFQQSQARQKEKRLGQVMFVVKMIVVLLLVLLVIFILLKIFRRPKAVIAGGVAGANLGMGFGRKRRRNRINGRRAGSIQQHNRTRNALHTEPASEPKVENQGIIDKARDLGFERERYGTYDKFLSSIVACASPIVRKAIDKSLPLETQVTYVLKRTAEAQQREEQERAEAEAAR